MRSATLWVRVFGASVDGGLTTLKRCISSVVLVSAQIIGRYTRHALILVLLLIRPLASAHRIGNRFRERG